MEEQIHVQPEFNFVLWVEISSATESAFAFLLIDFYAITLNGHRWECIKELDLIWYCKKIIFGFYLFTWIKR